MKRLSLAIALSLIAGLSPIASAADASAPVVHPATIGGGVRKPWTPPYALASLNGSNISAMSVIGVASLLLIARARRKDYQ